MCIRRVGCIKISVFDGAKIRKIREKNKFCRYNLMKKCKL